MSPGRDGGPSSMADITSIRTIGIPVTDQDRAVDFYVGTLGFSKRIDVPTPQLGGRWIELGVGDAPTSVAIIPAREGLPAGVPTGIRFHTTDAAALHARLTAAGVAVGELLAWPGVPPMFEIRDPDGNTLNLTEEG